VLGYNYATVRVGGCCCEPQTDKRLSETTPKIYWATCSIAWTPTPDYITYHDSANVLSKTSNTSASPCASTRTPPALHWTHVRHSAHNVFLCGRPLHSMLFFFFIYSLIPHLHPYKSESVFPTRLRIPLLSALPVSHGLCFYLCHLLFSLDPCLEIQLCVLQPHPDLRSILHLSDSIRTFALICTF
jgi:hypothetical protein